jgi:hypothetical protein
MEHQDMIHSCHAQHADSNLRAKPIAIRAFYFTAFWTMAGFVAISLLSLVAALPS